MLPKLILDTFARNPFELAGTAGTPSPDSTTSPGAEFLARVQSAAREALDYVDPTDFLRDGAEAMDEVIHDIADSAVPVYTHDLWATFVDLGAYGEDISDFIGPDIGSALERVPGIALYSIARRLAETLYDEAHDTFRSTVDEANDTLEALGVEHARNEADWWAQYNVGGRAGAVDVARTARTVLRGIEDGEPVVMDALPSADLSGEWADGLTVADLLAQVDLEGLDPACVVAQDLADVYVESFDGAVEGFVVDACRAVLDAD